MIDKKNIRITEDSAFIENFVPGITEYVKSDATWNQEIELIDKL